MDSKKIVDDKISLVLILIPDGSTKNMGGLSSKVDPKKISKGGAKAEG